MHYSSPTNAGGVSLYIKQVIIFNLITKPNLNTEGCEDIWIDVKMDNNKKVVVGAIYRHPKSNFIDFQTFFVNTIELLNALPATYYIDGDINIDLSKSDKNANIADYVNTLHSMGCSQVIANPTRITANSSSLLDHIYTNNHNQQILTHALYSDLSDHLPVLIMTKNFIVMLQIIKLHYKCYKRDCNDFIKDDFRLEMSEFCNSFLNVSDSISADELFNQFISQVKRIINKHAPLKQMSRKEIKLRRKPWITTDIIRARKNKNILFKEMLRNKTFDNINKYKKSRNLLTHTKESAKKAYYEDQLEKNCHDSGLLWKSINDIVKYKQKSSSLPSKIKIRISVIYPIRVKLAMLSMIISRQ